MDLAGNISETQGDRRSDSDGGGRQHGHLAFSSSSPLARRGRFGLKAVRQNRANKPFVNANALQPGGRFVSYQAAFSWRPTVGMALTQHCNSSGVMIVALPSLWAISSPRRIASKILVLVLAVTSAASAGV
jgi:hypothetical protein